MNKELYVTLTRTRDQKPLATVRNLPGFDADLTPAQMRALATALLAAAADCEAHPTRSKRFMPAKRTYELTA